MKKNRKLSQKYLNRIIALSLISALVSAIGMGCNSSTPAAVGPSCTGCSAITPENFVGALISLAQSGQIAAGYAGSKLIKDPSLNSGWFVIWDGATQGYVAVNVYNADLGGFCTQAETVCSGLNPQAAALAFAGGGNVPVYGQGSVSTSSGSITTTSSNGTVSFGTYSGTSSNEHQIGTYISGGYGSESISPTDTVNAYGNLSYPVNNEVYGNDRVTGYYVAPTGQNDSSGAPIFKDTYGANMLFSEQGATKDVDLQRAQVQNAGFLQKAADISSGLQMSFNSAVQLVHLADKIQTLQTSQNQLTDTDRSAVTQSLLGIAGITQDEVNQAVQGGLAGKMENANALFEKVAQNLGMPSATLRDQILPKLGVNLN
jgi:hypothetical protein